MAANGAEAPDRTGHSAAVASGDPLFVLAARWRLISSLTLGATLLAWVLTQFVMTKWYRATTVLRPVSPSATEERVLGLLGTLGGGVAGSLGMLRGPSAVPAYEFIPMLKSYAFTIELVDEHHLRGHFLKETGHHLLPFRLGPPEEPNWRIYRLLQKQFDVQYSITQGNLTLHYLDPDRREAERILGFFVDDLREKLRQRQVRDAFEAVKSLEAEAGSTPDALLAAQLEGLIARQIQRQKVAQVQANFAFTVLDPPASPDRPYSPSPPFVCGLAAVVVLVLTSLGVLIADWLSRIGFVASPQAAGRTGKRRGAGDGLDAGRPYGE